ncbi:MAG TPA: hypothetical protein VMS93_09270, partial [Candidatus Saccharimonadales bacterium]|nr:hypothetical protein [Candidatus Saccharimonadales bacterium]
RDFDHTYPACGTDTGVWGLSTRPAVLQVRAFDPGALPAGARWLRPAADGPTARQDGLERIAALLRPAPGLILETERLFPVQPSLTLVFFPFYVVRHRFREEGPGALVVDGVDGEVTGDHPEVLAAAGGEPWRPPEAGLAFLPLACPECTFSLEFRERDEVCRCPNCHRAWELGEDRLLPVEEWVEDAGGAPNVRLVPLWAFHGRLELPGVGPLGDAAALRRAAYLGASAAAASGGAPEKPADGAAPARPAGFQVVVPAFDSRNVEKIPELGARFTLVNPAWEPAARPVRETCRLGRDEARALATLCLLQVLALSPALQEAFAAGGTFEPSAAHLVWAPFFRSGTELTEPRSEAVIPEVALQPWE